MGKRKYLRTPPQSIVQSKAEMLKLAKGVSYKSSVVTALVEDGGSLSIEEIAELIDAKQSSVKNAIRDLEYGYVTFQVLSFDKVYHYKVVNVLRKIQGWSDDHTMNSRQAGIKSRKARKSLLESMIGSKSDELNSIDSIFC